MNAAAPSRETIAREHPEWQGWLRLLDAAAVEAEEAVWRAAATGARTFARAGAPYLAGAEITVERNPVQRWVRRLLGLASTAGEAATPLAAAARRDALDAVSLLEAAILDDTMRVDAAAAALGIDSAPLRAVSPILAMPLLLAVRGVAVVPEDVTRGWCPVCGAWPALGEARGLERARRLRCGRCGGDWAFDWLRCPFCDNDDHQRLGSLAPEGMLETRRADTCLACLGYVKTIAALTAAPPADVAVHDLATVDLDVAALARGFTRPPAPAAPLGARIVARERGGWRQWLR